MIEKRRQYMANYYINKRNYILNLSNKSKSDLTPEEQLNLDKYIKKFRPKTSKALRISAGPFDKGRKVKGLEKIIKQTIVVFN